MEEEIMTVNIPISLYQEIEQIVSKEGYSSVEEYITFVLRERCAQEKAGKEAFSKEEEEKVEERLRALGYID